MSGGSHEKFQLLPRVLRSSGLLHVCRVLECACNLRAGKFRISIDFGFARSMQAPSTGVVGEIPGLLNGQSVTDNATRGGGIGLGYTYLFNSKVGLDAGLEASRYTHNYSGDIDSAFVESSLREFTGNFIFRIPVHLSWVHPYVLAGAGAMEFSPTDNPNNAAGADSQLRSALTYGGGADFDISNRIGIRAEYRGATSRLRASTCLT